MRENKWNKIKRISGVIILYLFIFASITELSLRVTGRIYHLNRLGKEDLRADSETEDYTILCLGDSFTYGIGASQGEDYPKQLERLLNLKSKGKIVKVITGRPKSGNTTQILDYLQSNIDTLTPDIIIFMGGNNNHWNYDGYYTYLKGKNIFSKFLNCLNRIRIYRLAKILWRDIKRKDNLLTKGPQGIYEHKDRNLGYKNSQSGFKNGWIYKDEGRYDEAIRWFKEAIEANSIEGSNYRGLGEVYCLYREYERAIYWFKEGIKVNPKDSSNYRGIGWTYRSQQKHEEAIKWFKEGIRLCPSDSDSYRGIGYVYLDKAEYKEAEKWFKKAIEIAPTIGVNYGGLGDIFWAQRQYDEIWAQWQCDEIVRFFRELAKKDNPIALSYLKLIEKGNLEEELDNWVKFDVTKMIKICLQKKIKIILQNYPHPDIVNKVIEELAMEYSLPFVNNCHIFGKLWNKGERKEDFFVPDGHCNAKGYEIMAKNIYDKIVERRMVNLDD